MRAAPPAELRIERKKRVARAEQGQGRVFPVGADRGARAVEQGRQPAFGKLHVQPDQQPPRRTDERQFVLHDVRKVAQHLALFLPFLALELLQAVVLLHEEQRLEIAGFAGIGVIVDDALNAALEIRLERQDVTIRGQRHVIVLKVLGDVVLDREILDLTQAHEVQAAQFAAHEHQFGGAFILDEPVVAKAAGQGRKGHLRQGHGRHKIPQ